MERLIDIARNSEVKIDKKCQILRKKIEIEILKGNNHIFLQHELKLTDNDISFYKVFVAKEGLWLIYIDDSRDCVIAWTIDEVMRQNIDTYVYPPLD